MSAKHILADVGVDDIPSEDMRLVADLCGLSDALALMERLPGLELYIPASAKKGFDWEYIKKHYNDFNAATVAGRLGLNYEDVIRISKQPAPMNDSRLNNHLRLVSEKCGDGTAQRLAKNFPGYKFYVPINGLSIAYRKYIERSFDGTNTQELALRCGVSERYVRKVISELYQASAQLSLFDSEN